LRTRPPLLLAAAGLALLSLLGCQQDAIETHRVAIPEPPTPKVRLLGAMMPHDKDMWFFKVVGKLDVIEPLKAPFEDFVRSVRFDKPGEPISWDLPKGWERLPENRDRYATFRAGSDDHAPELTVHRYGAAEKMASIPDNVERWGRMYVGVRVTQDSWDQYVRQDKTAAEGVPITFVDMKGPGGTGGGGMAAPFAGGANPHAPRQKLSYTVPEGWKETDPVITRGGMTFRYEAALKVEKGGASALATISKLGGTGGGTLMNVNRWRGQVGLPPLDEAQLRDAARTVTVAGGSADYVDFTGRGERVLGVVLPREGETWFVKMQGPADLVGEQKAAFDKFVGSVKFDGGNGG
jgi:hypothetical protein